jgi:hypothetical protein
MSFETTVRRISLLQRTCSLLLRDEPERQQYATWL